MAIGTPLSLGSANGGAGATYAHTTTAAAPAGSLILVLLSWASNILLSSVTDSVGNTYTLGVYTTITNARIRAAWCENAIAAPVGTIITINWAASITGKEVATFSITGIATASAVDANALGAVNAAATTISVTSPTLAQADEIVFGWNRISGAPGTYTEASGFTTSTQVGSQKAAYRIVSSTAAVTYAPSWVTAVAVAANIISFKAALGTSISVNVTGVAAAGALDTVSVTTKANVAAAALTAAGALGTASVATKANTTVTGLAAASTLTNVGVSTGGAPVSVTVSWGWGRSGWGTGPWGSAVYTTPMVTALGSVTVAVGVTATVTTKLATTALGSVTVAVRNSVTLVGLQAVTSLGSVSTGVGIKANVTGLQATTALGTVITIFSIPVPVTGVAAVAAVGLVSVKGSANVFPAGLEAKTFLGAPFGPAVLVWGLVNDGQVPNWTPVDDTQTDIWVPVDKSQTPIWVPVVDG